MKRPYYSSLTRMILRRSLLPLLLALIAVSASVPASAQDDLSAAERQRRAKEYFINGTSLQLQGNRHAEAILEFQESLKYDSSVVTLTAMSRSYLELRKLDRAEAVVRHALERDPESSDAWELLAEILISSGQYDEGLQAYERIRELNPTRRQLYTLGRLYEPRDAAKAIEVYEELADMDPDVGVLQRLATLYGRRRDTDGQIRALERAYDLSPENVTVSVELVDVYLSEGRLDAASSVAERWSERARGSEGSLRVWGSLLSSLLEDSLVANLYVDKTRSLLDASLSEFPRSFPITSLIGAVALSINDPVRARQAFHRSAELVQDRAEPLLQISAVYLTTGYTDDAIEFLEEWQPKHPSDPRFLLMLGDAHSVLPDERMAISYYRTALDLDPMIADAWLQLGGLYDQLGEMDSSDAAYERVLQLDPQNMVANNNYAYSLAVRGSSLSRAREMAWTALQQNPNNAAYLDTYAWILFRIGEYDRARTYIEQAVIHGGNATHYEHLGDILEKTGEIDGAVRAWREALEREPDRSDLQRKIDRYR